MSREALRQHLVASRVAGEVATTRENNLANYARMSRRDPGFLFGLRPAGRWSPAEVLALMAARVGVHPDAAYAAGIDTIDPDRTVDRLDAMVARLRLAADRRERVLVAVPLDDNVLPHLYEPVTAYLLRQLALPQQPHAPR